MTTVHASGAAPERAAEPVPRFPGVPAIIDGSEAIGEVETRIAEAACAYPITPSTTMAAVFQAAVANGARNLWGTPLAFAEPESEHSSASAAEGFALAGGRVTNFTAGQGLILMKEVLYVIAGKRLPAVFHVGARALTSQALNIHAGHDDVYGVADTGWGIVFARNAQEAADLTAIARRTAEATETPFLVCQDGFLTTHTLENVLLPEDDLLREFVGDPRAHLRDLFDPAQALMSGVVQNQDSYMKGRIAQRGFTDRVAPLLARDMTLWGELTGRHYGLVAPYRCDGAEAILVAMGTMADTAISVVDHLRAQGRRVGALAVTSYRPFPAAEIAALLMGAAAVAVVERADEPLAADNPLTRETKAALYDHAATHGRPGPAVLTVAAGLGSRDISGADLIAVFDRLAEPAVVRAQPRAVLGIRHPLAISAPPVDLRPEGAYSMRGHSIGGFGSVTTNKVVATVVGELFGLHVQAYPRYGSEKKGLPTTYYLTVADGPIREHAELPTVDFVPVHGLDAFEQGDPLRGLADEADVFVQTSLPDPEAIWAALPAAVRAEMIARRLHLWALDTVAIAARHAPRADLSVRMQGIALVGVFLRVTPFARRAGLGRDALLSAVRHQLERFYGKKGARIVAANLAVISEAFDGLIDVTGVVLGLVPVPRPTTTALTAVPPTTTDLITLETER
ncbi:MAG TPA: 2-oxoacid:acceptor oxidoreductase family protein [Candidatus Limnocylindrales bacterium]